MSPSDRLPPPAPDALLAVRDLVVEYRGGDTPVRAVDGVSFDVGPGEVVALVGESGSGKSTIARALLRMLPETAAIVGGSIRLDGNDVVHLGDAAIRDLRGRVAGWVPQDPMVSLNPLHRVGRQVQEPLAIHGVDDAETRHRLATAMLDRVGINRPDVRARQYPHELSGGMRQRVLIAGALITSPRLVIADEPTTALDVTIQKRILDDVGRLVAESGSSVLLITHDLAVAADRADRVIVLKDGRIVETGPAREVLRQPQDPYTRMLVASAPALSSLNVRSQARAGVERAEAGEESQPLLAVEDLRKVFPGAGGSGTLAVADVSFEVPAGSTLAIVGESGSGKSTIGRLILGLERPTSGRVLFRGQDISHLSADGLRSFRRQAQLIYQNAYASLNPRMSVAAILAETFRGFDLAPRREWRDRAAHLLDRVGLGPAYLDRLPAALSGGQRQRVAIARAIAAEPRLIVCDEPVSALDVTVQAQVLDLFEALQDELGLTLVFISHDLAVVRRVADEILVAKDGRIVERGPVRTVFDAPRDAYTKLLLDSIPGQGLHTPAQAAGALA